MQLYTSYYAKYRNGEHGVQISRSAPPGFQGRSVPQVAPSAQLLADYKNGYLAWGDFSRAYLEQLSNTSNLRELFNDGEVLLCWEGRDKTCHRSLLAAYLTTVYPDIQVTEL